MTEIKKVKVGELRPSQILFSGGVGSIIDLPNLSAMVMGIDDWETQPEGELIENRLLAAVKASLGSQVNRLMSPPVPPEQSESNSFLDPGNLIGIPVSPFPTWGVCPVCRKLAPLRSQVFELKTNLRPDRNRYVHTNCGGPIGPKGVKGKPPKVAPTVVPTRFLAACKRGHLDDFPWHYYVHRGPSDCKGGLRLREYGVSGSAADIEVRCDTCGQNRRMSDAFGKLGELNMPCCRGRHAHLRQFQDGGCVEQMIGISLGASNSWFPLTLPALSIPSHIDPLAQLVEQHWAILKEATSLEILAAFRRTMNQLRDFAPHSNEEIWQAIQQYSSGEINEEDVQDIKAPEWQVFSTADTSRNSIDFRLDPVAVPSGYQRWIERVVLAERLREVRALIGFTRIESPGDFSEMTELPEKFRAPLSRNKPSWVPASEVKGEGIFIQFKESEIRAWEERSPVLKQYNQDNWEAHRNWRAARGIENPTACYPGIRYILLHSFAHALMRQFSLECGYNAASLRERIYSRQPEDEFGPMAGILIYTAAPDSEGTLGGLVRLGQPEQLERHIDQALEQIQLCASDPLCAEHRPGQNATALHWAACHSCLFSPETSCERGNKYLDRAVLVPTVKADAELAFFQGLGDQESN